MEGIGGRYSVLEDLVGVSLHVSLPSLFDLFLLIRLGFADEHALILYVYLSNYDDGTDESVLTVCMSHQQGQFNVLTKASVLHIILQHMISMIPRITLHQRRRLGNDTTLNW
jgi:hypothetical protein